MANSLGGFNLAAIAQGSLKPLRRAIGPILSYATDFSDQFLAPGSASITTRVMTNITGTEYTTASTGYTSTDITSTAVTVTPTIIYGQHVLNDLERNQMSINYRQVIDILVGGVANKAFAMMNALVLNANYATNLVSTSANFDADDLADLGVTLTATKSAQKDGRVAVLNAAYAGNVSKDADVAPAYAYGSSSVILDGVPGMPRVRGFAIHEMQGVATNAENLVGWVSDSQALVCVARMPDIILGGDVVAVETVTDEETGMSLALTLTYADGNFKVRASTLFGVSKGTDTLVRILSA